MTFAVRQGSSQFRISCAKQSNSGSPRCAIYREFPAIRDEWHESFPIAVELLAMGSDKNITSRRGFLRIVGTIACFALRLPKVFQSSDASSAPDYVLHIGATPVEIAPKQIVSTVTYNGQFPGPLLRFKEGQPVTIEVHNDTDSPEQLHWHGQMVSTDVDGAAEEGAPFIPARGMRRIAFTPRPSGFRFYRGRWFVVTRCGAALAPDFGVSESSDFL